MNAHMARFYAVPPSLPAQLGSLAATVKDAVDEAQALYEEMPEDTNAENEVRELLEPLQNVLAWIGEYRSHIESGKDDRV